MSGRAVLHCLTCSRPDGPFEIHHVAGELNHPSLVVDLCQPCHRLISYWQGQAGVYLGIGPRHPIEVLRAAAVGAVLLVRLFAARHPSLSPVGTDSARLAVRGISACLDLAAPADREGRWGPRPHWVKHHQIHPSCHEPELVGDAWMRLLDELDAILGDSRLSASYLLKEKAPALALTAREVLATFSALVAEVGAQVRVADRAQVSAAGVASTLEVCLESIPDLFGEER